MDWPRPDGALFRAASVHGRHHDENGDSKSRAPNPRILKLYDAHFSSYEVNVSLNPTAPAWGAKTGKAELHNGRWTNQEHLRFLQGLEAYGKDWKKIQVVVGTRSGRQVRSHGQKYFQRFQAVKMSGQIGDNDFHVIMDGKKTFGRNRPESIETHPGQGNSRVLARGRVGACAGDRKPCPVSLPCGSCLPPGSHRPLSPRRPKPSSSRKPRTMAAWALRPNAALPSFASKLTAFSSRVSSTEPLPSPSSPPRPPRPTTDRPPRVALPCLIDLVLLVQEGTASCVPTTAPPSSFASASVLSPLTDPSSCGDTGLPSRGEDGNRTEGSTETSPDEDLGATRTPSPQSWAPAPPSDISLPDQAEVGLGTKSRKRPTGLCSPDGAAQRPRQGAKEGETWENPVETALCQEVFARFSPEECTYLQDVMIAPEGAGADIERHDRPGERAWA